MPQEVAHTGLTAKPGDRIVVRGHHVGDRERDGEILEALGEGGGPPFVVRWSDDGHVSRIFPGSDTYVQPARRRRARRERGEKR